MFILAPLHFRVSFTGVNLSPGQINTAIKRARKAHIKNVHEKVVNYLYLPFKPNYFDGIMGVETFCHIEDKLKPQLFKELYRVLKNGGRIAIFDAFLSGKKPEKMYMLPQHAQVFRGWTL